jgi:hypothetical protein
LLTRNDTPETIVRGEATTMFFENFAPPPKKKKNPGARKITHISRLYFFKNLPIFEKVKL